MSCGVTVAVPETVPEVIHTFTRALRSARDVQAAVPATVVAYCDCVPEVVWPPCVSSPVTPGAALAPDRPMSPPTTGGLRRCESVGSAGVAVGVPLASSVGQTPCGEEAPAPVKTDVPEAAGMVGSLFGAEKSSEGSTSAGP